jgi:hypothetical protein
MRAHFAAHPELAEGLNASTSWASLWNDWNALANLNDLNGATRLNVLNGPQY